MKRPPIHGLMAEFDSPTQLVHATRRAHEEGYRKMDAYTPFPVEELSDAIGFRHTKLPLIVLIGGLIGCLSGYLLQFWVSTMAYPINVGIPTPPSAYSTAPGSSLTVRNRTRLTTMPRIPPSRIRRFVPPRTNNGTLRARACWTTKQTSSTSAGSTTTSAGPPILNEVYSRNGA